MSINSNPSYATGWSYAEQEININVAIGMQSFTVTDEGRLYFNMKAGDETVQMEHNMPNGEATRAALASSLRCQPNNIKDSSVTEFRRGYIACYERFVESNKGR